jgi:hypothetical protein
MARMDENRNAYRSCVPEPEETSCEDLRVDGMTIYEIIYKMGEDGSEVIHVINYVIKHYAVKAHGGVEVLL